MQGMQVQLVRNGDFKEMDSTNGPTRIGVSINSPQDRGSKRYIIQEYSGVQECSGGCPDPTWTWDDLDKSHPGSWTQV